MTIVPQREYLTLLVGDIAVFTASLWVTLGLRHLAPPSQDLFLAHLFPFALLFVLWVFVFFLAGLYGRHTNILRAHLPETIFYTQLINVSLAAVFFFILPHFGIAPKTVLAIYLLVSSLFIFLWRTLLFPHIKPKERVDALLIAAGEEAEALKEEVNADTRLPFRIAAHLDPGAADAHKVIQQVCHTAENGHAMVIIADLRHPIMASVLPIVYDSAFRKERFALLDVQELYQELYERVPLSLIRYDWILAHVGATVGYDYAKRILDVAVATVIGAISLLLYPFIMLAIKLDDGGDVFFHQGRIGQFGQPIHILKFRSMGVREEGGEEKQHITRVGSVLRRFRLDELPQIWNVLKGDLSLVGPRPEIPTLATHYARTIPFYDARHLIAPGLTGWAQLKHDQHPHHQADVSETKRKLSFDLYYLKNRSFMLDLYVMFQTARVVLTERGS